MRFSGTTEYEWTTLSMRFSGVVCTVTTNNSPCTEKWGVRSRPLHRNVCLFECYQHKDVNVLMLPTVGYFRLRVTHRKSPWLCLSVTYRKLLLFQGYPQKNLKVTKSPTERCYCFNDTHRKAFDHVSELPTENRNCLSLPTKEGFFEKAPTEQQKKLWATQP